MRVTALGCNETVMEKMYRCLLLLTLAFFTFACEKGDDAPAPTPTPDVDRTVLVYLASDNNLYRFALQNLNDMKSVMEGLDGNLLVYIDEANGTSRLSKIESDGTERVIETYGKENSASAAVLSYLAEHVQNMVVASADLSNSDKTDGFLKKTHAMVKGDFTGRFLQPGVAEFTMACIMNGMALHGGVIPACGTFFVFSDYMKPALRIAALQRLPVKYVWTHDSFRVGEDGPTHQPIEHEAQLRLMEQLRNHKGERSVVVLRPADSYETVAAWKIAMENERPTALILSRQNIKNLPAASGDRAKEAMQAVKGAYIVEDCAGTPDVILLASGSEVATLVDGAEKLKADGVKVRVVSVPSEGLFRDQSKEYQKSVLPCGVPKFGLTSGLPVTLAGLVACDGEVYGLDHFGYSAPASVLDKEFGFSGENVYNQVKAMLKK